MRESKIIFYGGAGSVTGSNFMLDTGAAKFLVDCGLEQGVHEGENWKPFAYDPKEVSHLIITHAHIDHIGRIPKLVKDGFVGKIISTKATKALAGPLLLDAMEIEAFDARKEDRALLYEAKDIDDALKLWEVVGYHEPMQLPDDITLELLDAGHILGSAMAKFSREGKTLVVTGDLGGGNSPLLAPTEGLPAVDYLVMESVYGDRKRDDEDRRERLEDVIEDTFARGGTLLIPAFSTERTQDLLFEIRLLMAQKRVPSMPVYLDSPLAEKITQAYLSCPEFFNAETKTRIEAGENIFAFPELTFVQGPEDSSKIQNHKGPKIIIAGSGMGSGGRILSHERYVLPDPNSTLLVVGYQAVGTLGRQLIEGAKKLILKKETIVVNAKVETIYGYSAHMDSEQLVEFANKASDTLKQVFVVEGEPAAANFLTQRLRDYIGLRASAPSTGESATIEL